MEVTVGIKSERSRVRIIEEGTERLGTSKENEVEEKSGTERSDLVDYQKYRDQLLILGVRQSVLRDRSGLG